MPAIALSHPAAGQPPTFDGKRTDLELYVETPTEGMYDDEARVLYDDGRCAIYFDGFDYIMSLVFDINDTEASTLNLAAAIAAKRALGLRPESMVRGEYSYTFFLTPNTDD